MEGLDGWSIAWTWLAWLAILGAVVRLGVWAVRSGLAGPRETEETPEEALEGRYARGEIDQAEYERLLAELRT